MPRVVFQLLWDYIQDGRPVVAFVKNMAHDGRYYWVVALVVAIPDGYLSVRFKPTSPLLATVQGLYTELRALEASLEEQSNDRKAAIAASTDALNASLHALGFSDYDHFMHQALKQEMQSREQHVRAGTARAAERGAPDQSAELDALRATADTLDQLVELLNVLFADLESYVQLSQSVRTKSGNVTDLSGALRVSAMNGVIAANKLGSGGAGLRPVLGQLQQLSEEITKSGDRLSALLDELAEDVDLVVFNMSAAKLQIEMTAQFAHELVEHASRRESQDSADRMTEGAMGNLHACSCETVRTALGRLAVINSRLKALTETQTLLVGSSRSLRPIYLAGKVEMAYGAGARLETIFSDLGDQMEATEANLDGLKGVLKELELHLVRGLGHGDRVESAIAQLRF